MDFPQAGVFSHAWIMDTEASSACLTPLFCRIDLFAIYISCVYQYLYIYMYIYPPIDITMYIYIYILKWIARTSSLILLVLKVTEEWSTMTINNHPIPPFRPFLRESHQWFMQKKTSKISRHSLSMPGPTFLASHRASCQDQRSLDSSPHQAGMIENMNSHKDKDAIIKSGPNVKNILFKILVKH